MYLLHQTARDFLICQPDHTPTGWQYSLYPDMGDAVLFRGCVSLLNFSGFDHEPYSLCKELPLHENKTVYNQWQGGYVLLYYATPYLGKHLRSMPTNSDDGLLDMGFHLCSTSTMNFMSRWPRFAFWLDDDFRGIKSSENNLRCDLIAACRIGWYAVTNCLISDGTDVNVEAKNGSTPLAVACRGGHEEVMRLLLECGADSESQPVIHC